MRRRERQRTHNISIHALREEGDWLQQAYNYQNGISIHALREEGDYRHFRMANEHPHFNPRPPRGGRRKQSCRAYTTTSFQSTPSARRATRCAAASGFEKGISIHALREEGDSGPLCGYGRQLVFQSTPSARRATIPRYYEKMMEQISIHALREEGDRSAHRHPHR